MVEARVPLRVKFVSWFVVLLLIAGFVVTVAAFL
jgi:hypothetical protein